MENKNNGTALPCAVQMLKSNVLLKKHLVSFVYITYKLPLLYESLEKL